MTLVASGMKSYTKQFSLKTYSKAVGAEITPELLSKINAFAPEPQAAEDIYVRKFILAHNGVDRDRERFPEEMLDDFADTLPGKSFLTAHKKGDLPIGLWFNTTTEEMTPAQFKELTGEEIKLPDGVTKAKVLWAWAYTLKDEDGEKINKKLDAGIIRHVSIGFRAADLNAVKDDPNGAAKYWEYVCPGEATEGSLVWLGAQQGAGVQKGLFAQDEDNEHQKTQGGSKTVDEFLKTLSKFFGKSFGSGDDLITHVKDLSDGKEKAESELTESQDKVKTLETEAVEMKKSLDEANEKLKTLEPMEKQAKLAREDMEKRYIDAKDKLEEGPADDDGKKTLKTVVKGFPLLHLADEVKHLEDRVADKFPDAAQTKGGDPDESRDKSDKKGEKAENPLKPETKGDN